MRGIKFRAWDKKTNKMREIDSIAFHNKRSVFDFDESNLPKVVNVWGRNLIEDKDIILQREKEQIVLMQYTGLKDKNGKEIYEGDVRVNLRGRYFVVEYDVDAAAYIGKYEHGYDYITDLLDSKLIGNIYENPELLNVHR